MYAKIYEWIHHHEWNHHESFSYFHKVGLKVSKFQKQILLFSFEPKNKRNYFLNSALASKMSQIKKTKALYYINLGVFNIIDTFIFWFDLF